MQRLIAAALFALFATHANAASIAEKVGVCDPANPLHCAVPDANGNLPVTGSSGIQNLPLGENNSTIAVTNTFQQALAGNTARKSCTIQNQGTHVMYVYASETNTPTTANSVQFNPGQQFSCQGTAQILITGTAGDAYVVTNQ